MKPGGKLVTCGATTGPEASFDIRFLFARQLSFLGSFMGTQGEFHEVMKHIFSGKLKPVVDRRLPFAMLPRRTNGWRKANSSAK